MTTGEAKARAIGGVSLRIIAAAIVLGFCYWAAGVVITVLVSVLLAYFVDPFVEWLERFRVPRTVGALIAMLVALSLVSGLAWLVWDRVDRFADDWPKYRAVLREAFSAVEQQIEKIEARFSEIAPGRRDRAVVLEEPFTIRTLLLRGLGSLYNLLLLVTFVPFLVYFMLAAKTDLWHATLQLFPPTERTRVKQTLEGLSLMLRGYIVGNVLVALILAVASWIFFWAIGLEYAFLTGLVSGVLNLVPYLGVVMAWLPPMVIGLTKFKSLGPFLLIGVVLAVFHLVAVNVLVPALVGRRVHLNAVAVTVALLFWGWMWGGMGLILAIPITATVKVVCDNVESWQPVGRWLGA